MVSSTFLHIAVNWDEMDKVWQYVTMDGDGIYAHQDMPALDEFGHYNSDGDMLYLGPVQLILFSRDAPEPLIIEAPKDKNA